VQLGTRAMQGVHRLGKSLRVAYLSEVSKDCCGRRVQKMEISTLSVVEGLLQGVRARIFLLRTQRSGKRSRRMGL
jgi:hypothetical protein